MPSMRRKTKAITASLYFTLLVFLCFDLAFGRIIDPGSVSPERDILALIADDLDVHGIDTVYGNSGNYPLPEMAVRVAPLAGFAPRARQDWGSYLRQSWASAFGKGIIGFIAAVPNQASPLDRAQEACTKDIFELGLDVCEFVRRWLAASSDQRVFIAFTKDDFDYANQVRQSLERAGYTVFVFLKGKDEKPWADPGMVGEVFAQSRFKIVIDSANARGSPGIAFEHECCGPLLEPDPPTTPLMLALQRGV
jgi:hypothetical protein